MEATTAPPPPEADLSPYTTYYGVDLYVIGEDGEHLIAFGHVDKRRFLAACNRYARHEQGLINLADDRRATWKGTEAGITHQYARIVTEDSKYDWEIWWTPEPHTGHPHPITLWSWAL